MTLTQFTIAYAVIGVLFAALNYYSEVSANAAGRGDNAPHKRIVLDAIWCGLFWPIGIYILFSWWRGKP